MWLSEQRKRNVRHSSLGASDAQVMGKARKFGPQL